MNMEFYQQYGYKLLNENEKTSTTNLNAVQNVLKDITEGPAKSPKA